ncbi:MAG: family 10 glycosylhydrolase [Abditibacteriota bacterium]|nr:family 10 glycosylhydrolase [Abditibacteriota bacterium]
MKALYTLLLALLTLSACMADSEIRGIWINSDKVPLTDREAVDMVREYHRAGFNLLFPEMICRGYAVYPSRILQRDPRFVDRDDVLQTLIREAHRLGMEVHPWVWCFRAGYTKDQGAIITNNPDWTDCSKNGDTLSVNGGLWISPFIGEAREFMLSLFEEIASRYDIDGFHLDYIRYEIQQPALWGYNKAACAAYARLYGADPHDIAFLSRDYLSWIDLRAMMLDTFVQETSLRLKRIKPELIVSAAVAADPDEARYMYCQNWGHWADNSWVDMLVPMTYTSSDERFGELMARQLARLEGKVFPCVGIGSLNFTAREEKNIDQIALARGTAYLGQALFASQYYTASLGDLLSGSVWKDKALLPFRGSSSQSERIHDYTLSHGFVRDTAPAISLPRELLPVPDYTVKRMTSPVVIDGSLEEWGDYPAAEISRDNTGRPATVRTTVKACYDDEAVVFAFDCAEPSMDTLKADAAERDGYTFNDDSVEVFLNMDPRGVKYNHFSVNTLNTHFDQQIYNASWNKEWQSAVRKTADGWTCEIRIPFGEMAVGTPAPGERWRINMTRNRYAGGDTENLCWSVTYGSFHVLERFGNGFFGD